MGLIMIDDRVKSTIEKIGNCKDFLSLNVSVLIDLYNMLATYPGFHVCTGINNGFIDMTIDTDGLFSVWIINKDKEYKFKVGINSNLKKIKDFVKC